MTRPEVVVFDLGKVLLDFDYGIAARRLATRSQSSVEVIHKFINQSPLLFRFETGLMTTQEFFAEFSKGMGFIGTLEEFRTLFEDIFSPMETMIELHGKLKAKKIPTFIFSNTNPLAIAHIQQRYPFFGGFDGYVYSHEAGAMKPDAKIYEAVERMTGKRGQQIVYIDDKPENIEAGAARGWQVILQESPERTVGALREMGLVG